MNLLNLPGVVHPPREGRPARLQKLDPRGQGDSQRAQLVEGDLPGAKVVDDLAEDAVDRRGREVHQQALGDDQGGPPRRDVPGPALTGQVERPEGVVARGRAAKDPVP